MVLQKTYLIEIHGKELVSKYPILAKHISNEFPNDKVDPWVFCFYEYEKFSGDKILNYGWYTLGCSAKDMATLLETESFVKMDMKILTDVDEIPEVKKYFESTLFVPTNCYNGFSIEQLLDFDPDYLFGFYEQEHQKTFSLPFLNLHAPDSLRKQYNQLRDDWVKRNYSVETNRLTAEISGSNIRNVEFSMLKNKELLLLDKKKVNNNLLHKQSYWNHFGGFRINVTQPKILLRLLDKTTSTVYLFSIPKQHETNYRIGKKYVVKTYEHFDQDEIGLPGKHPNEISFLKMKNIRLHEIER